MSITVIDSNSQLSNIEQHFKVLAGPGAGKTRFLVNHIKNILNNSNRLKIQRKVACITYTNIASETILSRVGDHGGRLEISTIHSFLYKYIVKPYVHLIAANYDLDALSINGHDDIVFTSYSFIKEWKTKTGQYYLDDTDVIRAFEKLRWKFDAKDELIISTPYPIKSGTYNIKVASYLTYKKMVWEKGLLHHDDVLFFSYEIVRLLPFVLEVMRANFPYFLIDEFQDTSPIQIQLLKLIAQKETIVGVVGDEAQSIYSFLGALPGQLQSFQLAGMALYEIKDNWRSSNQIVGLLNKLRPTLKQEDLRRVSTSDVWMVVGEKIATLQWMNAIYPDANLVTLSRGNLTANTLQKGIGLALHTDLLVELKAKDANSDRRRTIGNVTKAVEYAKMGYFKDALKTIGKLHHYNKTEKDKKLSLKNLKTLLDNEGQYVGKQVMDLYNLINTVGIATLSKFKAGAAKTFYEATPYDHLALAVKNLYEAGSHRTIHKSKGEEFEAVMLVLDKDEKGMFNEEKELAFLLKPDLIGQEEHRIMYVAISRPKDHLVISVPSLSAKNRILIEALSVKVQILS